MLYLKFVETKLNSTLLLKALEYDKYKILDQPGGKNDSNKIWPRFGKVWGQYDMSTPYLSIADPEILKKIMVKSFDSFSAHADSVSDQNLRSLDLTNGQEWKVEMLEWEFIEIFFQDLRKGLSPTFTSGKIKGMLELLEGGIDQMIDHLEEVTDKDTLVEVKVQKVICKKHIDIQTKAG